jgi:hypothetical protein
MKFSSEFCIHLDPEYQTFVANMNAPVSAAEALPNAETMLKKLKRNNVIFTVNKKIENNNNY